MNNVPLLVLIMVFAAVVAVIGGYPRAPLTKEQGNIWAEVVTLAVITALVYCGILVIMLCLFATGILEE